MVAAVMLSTTVTSERIRHVYDLFLIRPVGRGELIVAKFLAALVCLFAAALLSIVVGVAVDAAAGNLAGPWLSAAFESLAISLASMAVASSAGILFGVLVNTVAVSAILSVYLGNQLGAIIILPVLLVEGINPVLFSIGVGIAIPAIVMTIAIRVFTRKSL